MKKNILVIIRRGFLEFEYILPLLKKFNEKYDINTVFLNNKSFKSLKNNSYLFKEWKKINNNYYIQNKLDFFFYKLINYLLLKINLKILNNFREKINLKLHNPKILLKKLKIDYMDNLKYIFTEYGNFSVWLKNFYISKKRPRIIFFPSAPQIFLYKKLKNKDKKKLNGDLLLTISSEDERYWSQFIHSSKIKPIGVPGFDYARFISKPKKKYKKTILVALGVAKKLPSEKFLKKNKNVLDELVKLKDVEIIIKPHPFKQSEDINNLLNIYQKSYKAFKVSRKLIIELAKKSDVLICNLDTAATIYGLFHKIPIISFPFRDEIRLPSVNQRLNFIEKTVSINDFMKKLKSALYKTNSSVWIKQNKSFKKFYFQNKKTNDQIFNFIENYRYEKL
tara:strand:- start:22606 stop:23784 length:1179 start_codon:yes stop_codon:yes gene_type:complete